MFTGIIEVTAEILERTDSGLKISRPKEFDDMKIGASIAVSGTCLSITAFDKSSISFSLVPETWNKTKLGNLYEGDRVNLERSLKADGRFEGHVVQGHVEGTATVADLSFTGNHSDGALLTLEIPEEFAASIVPKGSIAVDGVSLTVASMTGNGCTIALIPHTLEVTTLGTLQGGDRVNIETDILGRYMLTYLSKRT